MRSIREDEYLDPADGLAHCRKCGGPRQAVMDTENMDMTVTDTANTPASEDVPAQENPPALVKKIGEMTYIVRVHFSTTSKETFSDKVKRMLRNEVREIMEREAAGE